LFFLHFSSGWSAHDGGKGEGGGGEGLGGGGDGGGEGDGDGGGGANGGASHTPQVFSHLRFFLRL
jgi:hypothetical protein